MKIRNGFVSNSSSSSFLIKKERMTDHQRTRLFKYAKVSLVADYGDIKAYADEAYAWVITENKETILGSTDGENCEMRDFLKSIGLDETIVEWRNSSDSKDYE